MKESKPHARGEAYKRADGKYSWRLIIDGNQRAKGTDRFDTMEEAIADFNDVMTYTIQEEQNDV